MIEYVTYDINVVTAHGFVYNAFSFACRKARAVCVGNVCIGVFIRTEILKIIVDFFGYLLTALHADDAELAIDWSGRVKVRHN